MRWSVDTLGWMGHQSSHEIVSRVLGNLTPGAIVLLHIGSSSGTTSDADALAAVISAVRARGYRFVSLRTAITR